MKIVFEGKVQIEIDEDRGVVYIHDFEKGHTILRICRLRKQAVLGLDSDLPQLDVIAVNPDDFPIEVLAQFRKELERAEKQAKINTEVCGICLRKFPKSERTGQSDLCKTCYRRYHR